jgi:hypothetical protein
MLCLCLAIRFSGRGFVVANMRPVEPFSTMIHGPACGGGAPPTAVAIASGPVLIESDNELDSTQ